MKRGIKMKIDLHIHTKMSDGELTPKEVIDKAIENKVKVISIADHDTIEAYTEEFIQYAENKGIKLIKGVEISTKINKCGIHVLGYNIDVENEKFKESLYKIRNARHEYLYKVSEKLEKLGYYINTEELDKIDAVTKAHIALDIIKSSKNEQKFLDEFGHIPGKGEFIETVMNENCPAYVKKETVTPQKAAEIIRQANGKVILAHPVAYEHEEGLNEEDILKIVKDMNPDGIESNYIYIDKDNNEFDECEKWNRFAKNNNLFVTVGTDFHNSDGIRPEIGFVNKRIELTEDEIDKIIENLEK
jgi:predicted metal-dependent phosphoesterase TrpH